MFPRERKRVPFEGDIQAASQGTTYQYFENPKRYQPKLETARRIHLETKNILFPQVMGKTKVEIP